MNSKQKGARGEREAAQALRDCLGIEARRGIQFCGSEESPDVKTSLAGVHFEVKRTEKLSIYKAMEQAEGDCGPNVPVVLHRSNHKEWLCIIKLADLMRLANLLKGLEDGKAV